VDTSVIGLMMKTNVLWL